METVQQAVASLTAKVESAQRETRVLRIIALLIPVIATGVLGVLGERWKSSLQETVDTRSQELSTNLALTEEFYKRKLSVYEQLYKQLVTVVNALKDAKFSVDKKTEAINGLSALYANYTGAGLYLSSDLLDVLKQFEDTATTIALSSNGAATMVGVQIIFSKAEQQMVKDLQLSKFSTVH